MRLSVEFFPPRTPKGELGLKETVRRLQAFRPDFASVTCGAGGTAPSGGDLWRHTAATLLKLRGNGLKIIPHLTMGDNSAQQTKQQLEHYLAQGVDRLVALRGDADPHTTQLEPSRSAETLVRRIRRYCAGDLLVEVAGYPEVHPRAASPAADLEHLKRKVEAGADGVITQYFYNLGAFLHFRERAQATGIKAPITPGIMPLTNFTRIVRFSKSCGADIPRWIYQHLQAYQDDPEALQAFGIEVVTELCQDLLAAEATGLHFYTLNQWRATAAICSNLGLASQQERRTGPDH